MTLQEIETYLPEYKGDKFGNSWAAMAYEALHSLSLGDSFEKNLSPFKRCLLLLLQERVRKNHPDFVVQLEKVTNVPSRRV